MTPLDPSHHTRDSRDHKPQTDGWYEARIPDMLKDLSDRMGNTQALQWVIKNIPYTASPTEIYLAIQVQIIELDFIKRKETDYVETE